MTMPTRFAAVAGPCPRAHRLPLRAPQENPLSTVILQESPALSQAAAAAAHSGRHGSPREVLSFKLGTVKSGDTERRRILMNVEQMLGSAEMGLMDEFSH